MRRLLTALAIAALACLVGATPASAHGLVGRTDLAIPQWLFAWAAAIVLVVSFVALAALWPTPRLEGARPRRLFAIPRPVEGVCSAVGVALFALLVYAGFAGSQTPTENALPTFVYVLFWVGLVPLSVLFGDVFRAFNPWRAIGRSAGWTVRRVGGEAIPPPLESRAAGALACRRRPGRLRLARAGVHQRRRPEPARRARARLRGRAALRHVALRRRSVEPARRRLRRLLRDVRPHLPADRPRPRAPSAPAAERPGRADL